MISITLNFTDLAEAAATLTRLAGAPAANGPSAPRQIPASTGPQMAIAHADRPDVGEGSPGAPPTPTLAIVPAAPPALDPAAVFGGAVAPAAPTAPVAPTPPTAVIAPIAALAGPERDSSGIVWDSRIHASTKTKKADGTWTAKRNVDDALRATVEAELRGLPAPAAAAAAAPVAPPAAPPAAPVVAPVGNAHLSSFAAYMAHIGSVFTNKPVEAFQKMTQALTPHGMQNVGQLAGRPELIPTVDAEFQRLMATA